MAHIFVLLLLEDLFAVDDAVHDGIIVMFIGLFEINGHFIGIGAHLPRQKAYARSIGSRGSMIDETDELQVAQLQTYPCSLNVSQVDQS